MSRTFMSQNSELYFKENTSPQNSCEIETRAPFMLWSSGFNRCPSHVKTFGYLLMLVAARVWREFEGITWDKSSLSLSWIPVETLNLEPALTPVDEGESHSPPRACRARLWFHSVQMSRRQRWSLPLSVGISVFECMHVSQCVHLALQSCMCVLLHRCCYCCCCCCCYYCCYCCFSCPTKPRAPTPELSPQLMHN